MSHCQHLTTEEREKVLIMKEKGESKYAIAREIGRAVSTVTRELRRNSLKTGKYSATEAEKKYRQRRKKCRRKKLLGQEELRAVVTNLFMERQWSPEQISYRLTHEGSSFQISYPTIYRAIYAGILDTPEQKRSHGNRAPFCRQRSKRFFVTFFLKKSKVLSLIHYQVLDGTIHPEAAI